MKFILLTFYFIIPFLPNFGESDRIASQWVILSFINIISLAYITYFDKGFDKILKKNYQNYSIMIFTIYLMFSLTLGIFVSVNQAELFIEFFRYSSFLIALVIINRLVSEKKYIKFLFGIIIATTFIEIFGVLLQQIQGLKLIGFTANKNIAVQSIALKINIIYLLLFRIKNVFISTLLYSLTFLGYYLIISINSKAGILLVILNLLILFSYTIIKHRRSFKKILIPIFLILLFASNVFYKENNNIKRAFDQTINYENDQGNLLRLKYLEQTSKALIDNPFTGVGLGNWKIRSIEYDNPKMENYIVQYHAHNDFAQSFAENGIAGGTLFLLFFLSILYKIKKIGFKSDLNFIIFLCLLSYLIDSILNFPIARVISLLNLIFIIVVVYNHSLLNEDLNIEENH